MPTNVEDTCIIPYLKTKIIDRITKHPNHTCALYGNFNRDIALRQRQTKNTYTPPQEEDLQWKSFTTFLNLEHIPSNTSISRQWGYNYTSTSLIDGFYIHSPDNNIFISTTNTNMNLSSNHYPVTLHIPHNTLIARPLPPTNTSSIRILNPIPPENLGNFNITFFEKILRE